MKRFGNSKKKSQKLTRITKKRFVALSLLFIPFIVFVLLINGVKQQQIIRSNASSLSQTRDKYQWPFSRYSIWNMPIGSQAQYVSANLSIPANGSDSYGKWYSSTTIKSDPELIGVNPADPLKPLNSTSTQVHVPPTMSWDGSWNGCASFLQADNMTIIQGQPLVLSPGGDPSWQYKFDPPISLGGDGAYGCHGGSALSGLGGAIRKGELSSTSPITHALKFELYCHLYCYPGGTAYRWPATTHDGYAFDANEHDSAGEPGIYNGSNPQLQMGALLALKKDVDLSKITSSRALKIAQALRDYGAYVVDDTHWNAYQFALESGAEWSDGSTFDSDLLSVITQLQVVANNAPAAIGGGGNPGQCYAPPFSDGTVDEITQNPNGIVSEPTGCQSNTTLTPTPTSTSVIIPMATSTPTPSLFSANLIQNGSFENVGTNWLSPWYLHVTNGTRSTVSHDSTIKYDGSYSANVSITRSGTYWYVQLQQGNLPIKAGTTYTISFTAKASKKRTIDVTLQQNYSPFTIYGNKLFTLSTSWQHYSFTLTSPTSDSNTLLDFNLAQTTGNVWLDSVSIQ